jgi:hypothetical protein
MGTIQVLDGLHLDQDPPLHKKVGFVVAHIDAVIPGPVRWPPGSNSR